MFLTWGSCSLGAGSFSSTWNRMFLIPKGCGGRWPVPAAAGSNGNVPARWSVLCPETEGAGARDAAPKTNIPKTTECLGRKRGVRGEFSEVASATSRAGRCPWGPGWGTSPRQRVVFQPRSWQGLKSPGFHNYLLPAWFHHGAWQKEIVFPLFTAVLRWFEDLFCLPMA